MPTFTQAIQSSNDNGSKFGSGSSWTTTTVQLGETISTGSASGALRFSSVNVPSGSTINSATITWYPSGTYTADRIILQIAGIDEDNTADFSSDPLGRTKTTATVTGYHPNPSTDGVAEDTPSLTAIVQEIIDRAGWSAGNAMGFIIEDDGGTADNTMNWSDYNDPSGEEAVLTIDYTGGTTTSTSSSTSTTTSSSTSTSSSSTTLPFEFFGMKVSKPGIDVLRTNMPNDLQFSSQYNTLKYFMEGRMSVRLNATIDALTAETVTTEIYHNLGYFPFHVVYLSLFLTGNFYPQAIVELGSGAGTYATTLATQQKLILSLTIDNFEVTPTAYDITAYCYYKIYKNNLNL